MTIYIISIKDLNDLNRGGAEIQTLRLSQGLRDESFDVSVLSGRAWLKMPQIGHAGIDGRQLSVIWIPKPKIRLIGSIIFVLTLMIYLVRRLRHHDVVHVLSVSKISALIVYLVKLICNRVICRAMAEDLARLTRMRHGLVTQIHLWMLSRAEILVVQNDEAKALAINYGLPEEKLVVIKNGVDTDFFSPIQYTRSKQRHALNLPVQIPIICCANRLHPIKHTGDLIEAVAILNNKGFTCNLLVLGDGPERSRLEEITRDHGIEDRILFTGVVSNVRDYIQVADIFARVSAQEGHSNAIVEAMACGVPIVASNAIGNRKTIRHGENGFLVPLGDSQELASTLQRILCNPGLARSLGDKARQQAETEFSVDRMVERYLETYALP